MELLELSDKRILIVDDLPEMRSIMRGMMESLGGQHFVLAKDGNEAINALAKKYFDIVICDYNLGEGKDGQQILEEARHRNIFRSSAVFIMVTAENTAQMVMGALEFQPDAYLSKPVNKKVLMSRLEKLISKKASLRDVYDAMDNEQYDVVLNLVEEGLVSNPKNAFELLRLKSAVQLALGDYDEVIALTEKVLGDREILWAMFDNARAQFHSQQYSDSLEMLLKLTKFNGEFIAAYDWIAKIYEIQGDYGNAQKILQVAINKSPKSVTRQRALATVAEKNNDSEVAIRARKKSVSVGKGSILREASDYTNLAKSLVDNGSTKDVLHVINSMKSEFKDEPKSHLESMVGLSSVYERMGNAKASEEALTASLNLAKKNPQLVTQEMSKEIASSCLKNGKSEEATAFIEDVIRSNHENTTLLNEISDMYREAGLEEQGQELIKKTKGEIIKINNQGVSLIKEGKLDESIKLFSKAAEGMPRNPVINLNLAHSLIMQMKKSKPSRISMDKVMTYMNAARDSEAHHAWVKKLMNESRKLRQML